MADGSTAPGRPPVGKIMNDEEHAALLTYHLSVIRLAAAARDTAKGPVDEAKAELDEKAEELTKAFNAAKADLGRGYSRKYMESLIEDGKLKTREQVSYEIMRARDKQILGQPVYGLQPELFPGAETPTAARDEMAWTNEGFLRGMRGDLEELQDGDPTEFHQAIMAGYRKGQELTQERFTKAQEIIAARQAPDAGAAPVNMEAPEPGTFEHDRAEKASIGRARESLEAMGKAGPDEGDGDESGDEGGASGDGEAGGDADGEGDGFTAPEAELSAQKTRRAVKDAKSGGTSGEAVH